MELRGRPAAVSYTHLDVYKRQIDKAVKEAAEYEAQDKKKKEAIDARNDADSMVFQTEKALEEVGDKISADDKASVEAVSYTHLDVYKRQH